MNAPSPFRDAPGSGPRARPVSRFGPRIALAVLVSLLQACGEGAPDERRPPAFPVLVPIGQGGASALRVERDGGLAVLGPGGAPITEARRGAPASFDGLAIGRVERYRPFTYYDPVLNDGDGSGLGVSWFHAAELSAPETAAGSVLFRCATRSDDGEPGPEIAVRLSRTEVSAQIDIEVPDDERIVFTALTLRAHEGEGFYGLGQHFDSIESRGRIRPMQLQLELASESSTNEVHVPVPFLLSTRGYGLFVDDRHPAAFDLAHTRDDAVRVAANARGFRVHVLAGPDPLRLVEQYTALTAPPAHVPFWALGPAWWRNRNTDGEEVLSDARRARQMGLTGSLMWIDRPWQTYYQNFRFNPHQFPDPEGMFAELAELGYRALLHHSPQVNVPGTSGIQGGEDASERLYETYVESGWVVTFSDGSPVILPWGGGQGAFVDYSNPQAVAAVQSLLPRVTRFGVVGTKMDWDEYLQPNLGPLRIPMRFANGETNATMKSWYSALYHQAIYEGLNELLGEPSFLLVRHASPRGQQWAPCVWPGDLDSDFSEHTRGPSERQRAWNVGGLPAAIVACQSLGLAGFPCFGSDIGGYRESPPSAEVLLRWMGFGVFNPFMQIGGGATTQLPWSQDTIYPLPDEGWPEPLRSIEDMIDITRRFFRLRMDLFPYVHNELLQAERTGRPVVRPLWAMHPQDEAARRFDRDFYFGPDLLVAPVYVQGARDRELYLPEGQWVDLWTGERRTGGAVIRRAAPLDQIPVHLRDGAIVPLSAPDVISLMPAARDGIVGYADRPLTRLWVVPGRPGALDLFNGITARSVTEPNRVAVSVAFGTPSPAVDERIRFTPEAVELRVETRGTILDGQVTVRLVRAGRTAEPGPLGPDGEGWTTEADGRFVRVRVNSDALVEIRPAG